jgi:hypothetical protein
MLSMVDNPIPHDEADPQPLDITAVMPWEYKRRATIHPPSEEDLNQLGSIGWELCSIVRDGHEFVAYFKRMK